MKNIFWLVFVFMFQINGWAQVKKIPVSVKTNEQRLKEQANQMGACLLKSDMKGFAKFSYPVLVKNMGGEDNFVKVLESGNSQMRKQGNTFMTINYGEPSKIITQGNELQTTLPQTIQMKVNGGHVVAKSTLIAISTNKGLNWYFIEPPNQSIREIQKAFPNLSNQLLVPPKTKPRFYKY